MDNIGRNRENGCQRQDHYKSIHAQWMLPQQNHHRQTHQTHQNHQNQIRQLIQEREKAIQDCNQAIAEKKAAMAERDLALMQRDAAISDRDAAYVERDNTLAALDLIRNPNSSRNPNLQSSPPQLSDAPYDHIRDMHISEAYPISAICTNLGGKKVKRPRKDKKTVNKSTKKAKSSDSVNLVTKTVNDWKGQDLGLNQVTFDESTMPVPVCSCTGKYRQCYKWGNGGWQSSCCTTKMSMYPLPVMPNKRHARMGGRKMSGTVFIKLLSRLAAEGHDLSVSVDLKDHWAKHGTNRYITIK
ncbi:hypothetical protein LUZ60_007213 [Juncus effusus]|nr:hypothetical protein LUZ60_007213 [Juncus effusus]